MNAHGTPVLRLAPPYDGELIHRIEQGFSDKLGFDVKFKIIEDSSLLCGFVAYVSGIVYDISAKTQLDALKNHLMDSITAPAENYTEEGDIS